MSVARAVPLEWRTARSTLRLDRPVVVGIVNVTPDSFHDGGRHASVEAAVAHAELLLEQGADILDIGGESTRPGSTRVSEVEERTRVVPVFAELSRRFPQVPLSIDTVKVNVAVAAIANGATIINDVSAFRLNPDLAVLAAGTGAGVILMHSRGDVESMARYDLAQYGDDIVADVIGELDLSIAVARAAGIADACIVLDPGLGFAKRSEHSLALLAGIDRMCARGFPILAGPSRKRFTGDVSGGLPSEERLPATIAACVVAFMNGARLFRVHDVLPVRRALDLADAVRRVRA